MFVKTPFMSMCGPHDFRGPPPGGHHRPGPEGFGPGPCIGLRETPVTGLLHLAILRLVKEGPTYGSEIQRTLKEKFGIDEQRPVIYVLLRRMEDLGFLSSVWDTEGGGPARRIYRITEDGFEHLQNSLEGLKKVKEVIDVLLSGQ